jgi:hypothetical protein
MWLFSFAREATSSTSRPVIRTFPTPTPGALQELTAVHVHLIIAEIQHKATHSELEISTTIALPTCREAGAITPGNLLALS